jgi:GH43 family beta-xylosidase
LKFVESPQIKFDKDSFLMNMNMVELNRKKVMVRPSQAKSTKGKEVVLGEEQSPRMIKPKSLKDNQW